MKSRGFEMGLASGRSGQQFNPRRLTPMSQQVTEGVAGCHFKNTINFNCIGLEEHPSDIFERSCDQLVDLVFP